MEILENKQQIFYSDVNEAMMIKSQNPNLSVLISIENNPGEEDLFWNSFSVESIIKTGFIVVRMNQTENSDKIQFFDQLAQIQNIPSLFYFAPNSVGINHRWDEFPNQDEFQSFFENSAPITNKNETIENKIQQQNQNFVSSPVSNEIQNQINQTNQEEIILPESTPNNQNHSFIQNNPIENLNNKPKQNQSNNSQEIAKEKPKKVIKKARIAVQGSNRTLTHEFEPNQTLGDLRYWIFQNFGDDHQIFVVHKSSYLPEDNSMTIAQADLCPSAKLMLKDDRVEVFSHDDPENPSIVLEESPQRGISPPPVIRHGCFLNSLIKILSIFDPWSDYEEKEDFFEKKAMYDD